MPDSDIIKAFKEKRKLLKEFELKDILIDDAIELIASVEKASGTDSGLKKLLKYKEEGVERISINMHFFGGWMKEYLA